ncbi:MAG: hypothetical protein ABGY09_05120 [Euryarchaeota archaeon]
MAESVEEVIDLSEIPFQPMDKQEIHQLETVLLVATLFRPKVLEMIHEEKFLTWVDSLAVAAAALARQKAGYTVSEIAEELGRTEATIRKHLQGETKAGQLVLETYDMLKSGELKIVTGKEEVEEKLRAEEEELERLRSKVGDVASSLNRVVEALSECRSSMDDAIEELEGVVDELKELSESE